MTDAPSTTHRPIVIAIDGPAGAGKSTVARMLAERLRLPYFDTGAMYRAAGLLALRAGIEEPLGPAETAAVVRLLDEHSLEVAVGNGAGRILIDGEDPGEELRSRRAAMMASAVSALPAVRRRLVAVQRELGLRHGGVMEGRDIGTVVFPDAALKVYLTASLDERVRRRLVQLGGRDAPPSLGEMRGEVAARDHQDASRADSPLTQAADALLVDSTEMTAEAVVDRLLEELDRRRPGALDTTGREAVRSRNDAS